MPATATTEYTQDNRAMKVHTPLGKDVFLLAGLSGREAISQLFRYRLDLLVPNKTRGHQPVPQPIPFGKLLAQSITVELALPGNKVRHINGLCARITQGETDADFTTYHMEIVPKWWLLTRRSQSRIFQ